MDSLDTGLVRLLPRTADPDSHGDGRGIRPSHEAMQAMHHSVIPLTHEFFNLAGYGVITSSPVERAFRAVDRRFFVPQNRLSLAHADQPLREGHVHISAPHIYGTALEALELEAESSMSFLNLGSGTGYLSCMVATLLGKYSVHVAVEVCPETMAHAQESITRWKSATDVEIPPIELIHGNALQIDSSQGEAASGFDRIYVGASVGRSQLNQIAQLLRPGGILVGPVEDNFVKVMRIGQNKNLSNGVLIPRTLHGHAPMLSNDFSIHVLSGVRFATLLDSPTIPTVLPSRIWNPASHHCYPDSFRTACKEILLCAGSDTLQPVLPVVRERVNAASILPRALWMEVLSYTTRDWFKKPHSNEDLLRRRLLEEESALREMQEARQRAEARLATMERERDFYKLLAIRWQTRLRASRRQGHPGVDEDDILIGDDELPRLLSALRGDEGSDDSDDSDEELLSVADVDEDSGVIVDVDVDDGDRRIRMEESP